MELGMIGLGRMGFNMSKRLLAGKHRLVVYDQNEERVKEAIAQGAQGAPSVDQVVAKLKPPRIVWVMVPSGDPTAQTINALVSLLATGDILIDGGNSYYKDSVQRAVQARKQGVYFLDVGTSGGIWGLKAGYCLMIGGEKVAFERAEPIFKTLAPENGYGYTGPSGAGHFVKMVHNGIEYGMLQALGEGFELLHTATEYDLDLVQTAALWQHGSVIRCWLLELVWHAFAKDPHLESIKGYVDDSGEGRWAVLDAVERAVPLAVITHSLFSRFRSRQEDNFSDKVIAALRNEFGGHAVKQHQTKR